MLAKENFKFFYKNGKMLVSVKMPITGRKPFVIWMALGNDNRPFEAIIDDIRLAYEMLDDSIEDTIPHYHKEINIMMELPKLLGYIRMMDPYEF